MTRAQLIRTRDKLLSRLTVTSEILRGSLIHRITHHSSGCAKCARGEGHPLWVLTVSYPGGRTRQFSLHQEQVPEVRRWLDNYQNLKQELEAICELNHELLRADKDASKSRSKSRD
jgi:cyclopropane fatty-acyl-phospholipid synthase-like methyltransferase